MIIRVPPTREISAPLHFDRFVTFSQRRKNAQTGVFILSREISTARGSHTDPGLLEDSLHQLWYSSTVEEVCVTNAHTKCTTVQGSDTRYRDSSATACCCWPRA